MSPFFSCTLSFSYGIWNEIRETVSVKFCLNVSAVLDPFELKLQRTLDSTWRKFSAVFKCGINNYETHSNRMRKEGRETKLYADLREEFRKRSISRKQTSWFSCWIIHAMLQILWLQNSSSWSRNRTSVKWREERWLQMTVQCEQPLSRHKLLNWFHVLLILRY